MNLSGFFNEVGLREGLPSPIPKEVTMDSYFEIYVEDSEGLSVHDIAWDIADAKRKADELKPLYPNDEVGVIEYKEVGIVYVSE